MNRTRMVVLVAGLLVGLWVAALAGMRWADGQKITAEKVAAYVESADLATLSGAQREAYITGLADRVNRLPFDQRRNLRLDRSLERVFFEMNEAERNRYLDLTLPRGLSAMMEALNAMTPEQRQEVVERAMDDIRRAERERGVTGDDRFDEATSQRIINEGLRSYFSEASAETKLDLQPVIEQIQAVMQKRQ